MTQAQEHQESWKLLPGSEMVGWLPLGGLMVTVLNNHWWQWRWPNPFTGILTDFTVTLFFPFLVSATLGYGVLIINSLTWPFTRRSIWRHTTMTRARMLFGMALTATALVTLNLIPWVRDSYVQFLENMDIFNWSHGFLVVMDPYDILGCLFLWPTYRWGMRRLDEISHSTERFTKEDQ